MLSGCSYADVAKLVDATDLKSVGTLLPCRFDSGFPHHKKTPFQRVFFLWYGAGDEVGTGVCRFGREPMRTDVRRTVFQLT